MGFLQTLIHDITGHGGQPQQQARPQQAPQQNQIVDRGYAQYMNSDGSGGGFGPQAPAPQLHQPQLRGINMGSNPNLGISMPSLQGRQNPGFVPLQNSGFGPGGNPQIGAFQDQPGQLNAPNYGPQQGYFYDN